MIPTRPAVAASYAECRRVVTLAGSSFTPAFRLLGRPEQDAMNALYAFFRLTDDLADNADHPCTAAQVLTTWEHELRQAAAGQPAPLGIFPALADTLDRYQIPLEFLLEVIDGVRMDLALPAFPDFPALCVYLDRVASAVGLACMPVWGLKPGVTLTELDPPARAFGRAVQLTNILRDLREDAARGRCYLPQDELHRAGVRWPLAPGSATVQFLQDQITRSYQLYEAGQALLPGLRPEGRAIVGLMTGVYRALLDRIARDPQGVLQRRVRVSRWTKTRLLAQAYRRKWGWLA